MADIAGISGSFGFDPSRSNAAEDRRTSEEDRRAEEAARAAEETDAGSATNESAASNGTGTTTETGTDQNTTARQEREAEDQVSISSEAQQRLDEEASTPAAGAADVETLTPANDTNQAARQENSTSVVNGNRDDQSEQTRSLGQLVDQFA